MQEVIKLYSVFDLPCAIAQSVEDRLKRYVYADSQFKQVAAFGMLSGFIDEAKGKKLLENDTLKGMTCFMCFVIVKAMEKISDGETILKLLKDYYGAMLDLGATTFLEDFDMAWINEKPDPLTALPDKNRKNIHVDFGKFCYKNLRFSLCYGWSGGFVDFFYEYVLGGAVGAGYARIKIEPHLCGLTFAEGKIPTKYGEIYIKHELKGGKIHPFVDCPAGIEEVK